MANIKSQIKRNRQNEARRQRNVAVRSEMKTYARQALEAAADGDAESARALLRQAQSAIDRASAKGVLHKRVAARRKSRLVARVEQTLGA